jgi:hypothetical protein
VQAILNIVQTLVGRQSKDNPGRGAELIVSQGNQLQNTQDYIAPAYTQKPNAENAAAMMQGPSERQRVIIESRKQFDQNPIYEALLKTSAVDITRGEYVIQVQPGAIAERQAQELADNFMEDLKVNSRTYEWCLQAKIDGDYFLEVGVDTKLRQITRIDPFETLDVKPVLNRRGHFVDRSKAFQVQEFGSMAGGEAVFYPLFLVVWGKNNPQNTPRNPYGRPELRSAIGAFRRASRGWDDVAVRRAMSGGKTRVHTLSDVSEATVKAYREANKETLNVSFDNLASILDIFTTASGNESYKEFQGDSMLDRIGDIMHHIETGAIVAMTPLELIGYAKNINRDILEQKSKQYRQAVADGVDWMGAQFIEPLIDRHFYLNGVFPPLNPYTITRKQTSQLTPRELIDVGQAVASLRGTMVIGDSLILKIVSALLPHVSLEELQQAYALEIASPFPDPTNRMANLVSQPNIPPKLPTRTIAPPADTQDEQPEDDTDDTEE